MTILEQERAYRDGLRRLGQLNERNYRSFQQWRWLADTDTLQLITTEAVANIPAGKVRIDVLHRWAYTTVLRIRSEENAAAKVELEVRLYHDANSAEVTAVQVEEDGAERTWWFQGGANKPKEKLYWNTFLGAWLARMQVHIYAVPMPTQQCVNSY